MFDNINAKTLQDQRKHIDWVAILSIVLIIVFCITLITAYFFPIYPDEIQVRFWLSRLPYDFPEKISGAPACLSTFFQPIPSTMYLPGLIDWIVHGRLENVSALRQVGFVVVFLWISGLAIYLNARVISGLVQVESHLSPDLSWLYIIGFFIAIFSVGVFPFFLITNRGEQLILPCVVLLVAIFIFSRYLGHQDAQNNRWQRAVLVVLYFIAISLIIYSHPKGLFLTPFFVIVGYQLFSHFKSRLPFVFAMALLLLHIVQDISAFKYAIQCRELPQFEAMLKGFSIDPASLFYDPRHFFDQIYQSIIRFPKYLHQLGFQKHTDISYLPSLALTKLARFINILISLNIVIAFLGLLVLIPFHYLRKDVVSGRFITVNLVLFVLFGCALISAIFNIPKNWYDAGYLYALLLIIMIFFIGENFPRIFTKHIAQKLFLYLGVVALLSQAVLIQRYLQAFMDGYAGPSVSIAKYDNKKFQDDISAASLACNIDPVHSKKVVVDDYTYLYFHKSKWPMAITYIWLGNDDKSIRQFFSRVDSDGLVVGCTPRLSQYKSIMKREGNICCISKNELKNLFLLP